MPTTEVLRVGHVIHGGAHGDTPRAEDPSGIPNRRSIGRAVVNARRLVVGKEQPLPNVEVVGVGEGIARHPRPRGGIGSFAAARQHGLVGRQLILEVINVHQPGQVELAVVAQALGPQCLVLGLAQCGQEHAR